MNLYGQESELHLLAALASRLESQTMIDVGAEKGSLDERMLRGGIRELHALEPHPDNVAQLRTQFAGDARVTVHECAVGDTEGRAQLRISTDSDGAPLPFGHTLLLRPDTDEIVWRQTVDVPCRTLGSLVEAGELPGRAGILKVDTEGNDLSVVRGMGGLECDVVMVEHWSNLPHGLGVCPWSTEEMVGALRSRGFSHFAFILHRGEFAILKWDDGDVERGAFGNLVFLHDRILDRVLQDVLAFASALAERAVGVGEMYMSAAGERLTLIEELENVADERLRALEAMSAELSVRQAEAE